MRFRPHSLIRVIKKSLAVLVRIESYIDSNLEAQSHGEANAFRNEGNWKASAQIARPFQHAD